jgi:Asp-tRNA(Asn)/Glu-tRNA(Gln) amidotransferase A subunit family amidase
MGSDTCGSIRIPSAHNNLFGLRGTPGLSSRSGIIPLSHTQDIGGPLARSVADLAIMLDATVGPDEADPITKGGIGKIPTSYRQGLDPDSLKGARIGVLTSLFGEAPEDEEVTAVVRGALERVRGIGAEVTDVHIPDLEQLLQGSSVIGAEFKFDLLDFLASYPAAPVHSLDDILRGGLYADNVQALYRRANDVAERNPRERRTALVKRDTLHQRVTAFLADHRLDALAYPTLRRKPAPIGEPQAGSNCQLSPAASLPAIAIPAGFTGDQLPVGFELLGAAFSEQRLLNLAYAYEQAVRPRQPPKTTPGGVRR